ncbi:MAG TPA: thioredoxin [Anaerolineaceae bacterium]|nr:thioredoxin [Anaerolineaceae bacterium]
MSQITEIEEGTFQQEVLQSSIPVLVEFGATWCAPCKMLEPVLDQLAAEWQGKIRMVKIDVDQAANLAIQFQVMSVPTLILFAQSQPKERLIGFQPKNRITAKIGPHLA